VTAPSPASACAGYAAALARGTPVVAGGYRAGVTDLDDLDDLVRRWATGWAASRQVPLTATPDGWFARVGDAHRDTEHVSVRPSGATVVRLVEGVRGRPEAWLTLVGDPA